MNNLTRALVPVTALLLTLSAVPAAFAAAPLNAIASQDNATANNGSEARVRVVHASPDAPDVDVRVDGGLAFADIAFEDFTDYASLPPGTYNVKVEPAGAGGAGPFVIDADLTLTAGTDYTVIATDTLADIFPTVLVDDNSFPAAGEAKIRFFHGSPDAPAVDIAVADGGPVLIPDVAFGDTSDGYLSVPGGTYDLEVRVAGTTAVALTLPGLTFAADTVYTTYATGLLADGAADRTLYLGDDERFRVEVEWTDFQGNSGFGRILPLTDDSGLFWFFHDQNMELVVKVLDGCPLNDFYWFFYGALSNVEYDITVTDTAADTTRVYSNPARNFASFGDTTAFATCP